MTRFGTAHNVLPFNLTHTRAHKPQKQLRGGASPPIGAKHAVFISTTTHSTYASHCYAYLGQMHY